MAKILKNQTASPISLDIGLTIPPSGQLSLNPQDFDDAADSNDIITQVGNGNLIVNDGSFDLDIADGIRLIQGGFSNKIQLDDDLLTSSLATERVKVDVTGALAMDDGTSKVSGNDTLSGFLEDKIQSGSSKLLAAVQNEGSNESILIDVVSSNINTADLNNDAGFITSGQAPVQPGDIADFETTTQLNIRDTANRDRVNHTGTQLSSTISDFLTQVQSIDASSSLTLATNILTYTKADGSTDNVDLSLYLDDTNLARLVSGTLDAGTGILTVTRDDSSTFTIDLSALLDNQTAAEVPVTPAGNLSSTDVQAALVEIQQEVDLNTLKVSADGSIDTHSDVDVTTTPPSPGDLLGFDGLNFVPISVENGFTIFPIWAEENGGLSNNNRQWSFGNGSTGSDNIVIPIDCEIFAFSVAAESASGTCSFDVLVNDSIAFTSTDLANNSFESLSVPVQITAGQRIGYRTNTETGTFSDVRICAWFRVATSSAGSASLGDLTDVSITSPVSGQGIVFNGSNFVNLDIVEPSELATVATTGNYSDLSGLPTLGTAADNNETDFATAAQGGLADTAVQPVQIADFETTTQLNLRDTTNRNRSNHTGTQLSSTISDFTSRVQAEETTTSLSFNNATNILSFTDEDGGVTNIDLSLYLDDTNLARITSGTLDAGTGIATFTRDDLTTFTLDLSPLNDQAFINAAIATHETTIDNHDDVDVSSVAPVAGDILEYDGTNWIPGKKPFKDFFQNTTPAGTQTNTFVTWDTFTTNIPDLGNYKLCVDFQWSYNNTNTDFIFQILQDGTPIYNFREEPADAGDGGITVTNLAGGTFNTGTNQRILASTSLILENLTTGTKNFEFQIACQFIGQEATIYRLTATIERWD